jgi:hypothetical protein
MFLLAWLLHGLLFRWAATRPTDDAVERPLAKAGEAVRRIFAGILPRRSRKTGELP